MTMRTCALIPARQGSSLTDKNVRQFSHTSLLELAVEAALMVKGLDQVFVSSDSQHYLEIAERAGAKVELRVASAATSTATAQDVIDSTESIREFDRLVYLQPTSPLRKAFHIEQALELSNRHPGLSVVSVTTLKQHPEKILKLDESGQLQEISAIAGASNSNRRTSDNLVYPNGAIYILERNEPYGFSFSQSPKLGYFMGSIDSVDIDSDDDFRLAKVLFEHGTHN